MIGYVFFHLTIFGWNARITVLQVVQCGNVGT